MAFAPIISDVPVVLLCLFVVSEISGLGPVLAWLSILGGIFVGYLGYESLRASVLNLGTERVAPRSLSKAVLINLLNPHVYLFWTMVGAPTLLKGFHRGDGSAFAFAAGFYTCLVGSKILVAYFVSRSRNALAGRGYKLTMRILGTLLLAIAVWMLGSGIANT